MFTNDGNNVFQEMIFNKHLYDLDLEIFGPTIRTMWNKQPKSLKDDLTNRLVSLFRKDTFDTLKVLQKAGKHLNIVPRPI